MFFMGTYTPKLDDKGRLILPAKFREQLAEGLVVTQGQEKCLDVWPESDFMAEAERAKSRGMTSKTGRDYARMLFASAEQGTPDKQGRVLVPATLVEFARLGKDVVIAGVDDHLEIWNADAWDRQLRESEGSVHDVAERLAEKRS